MKYFLIAKTDKKVKLLNPLKLKGGFTFKNKMPITIYNREIIRYVLIRKLNNSLKSIINLYLLYDEDDEDNNSELLPRIELLRNILIKDYAMFLTEVEIEAYLIKFDRLEEKINSRLNKRIRRR